MVRVLFSSPVVLATVTGLMLVMAVTLEPTDVLFAASAQNTVMDLPTLVPTTNPPTYADLVVSSVETAGDPCWDVRNELEDLSPGDFMNFQEYRSARALLSQQLLACEKTAGTPTPCSAGKTNTFTVEVRNIGKYPAYSAADVLLSIDGVPTATTWTIGTLAGNGGETTGAIEGIVLAGGTHAFTVTVNTHRAIWESDFSNNTYSGNLTCV